MRGRLDTSSDTDDCRRFLRGLLGASDFGTTTADATGLRELATVIVTERDELTQAYLPYY